MPRALADEQERALVERYVAGENVRALAAAFAISPQTLYGVIARHGATRRSERLRARADQLPNMCKNGNTIANAAKTLGISESTATRVMRAKRVSDNDADDVCARLLRTPFPYPVSLSPTDIAKEFERLRRIHIEIIDGEIRPMSHVGIAICKPFFPNRYNAARQGEISALAAWNDADELRKAIQFQIRHGDPVVPHRVLRAITLRCRTPTIFRPAVAKFICERYCPRGGRVWDPCAGYGGRLLGAAASGAQYVATDVDADTVAGGRNLALAIGYTADLHLTPAEMFSPPSVDLVFTSPPYFDRERYSQGEQQSWKKYGAGVDGWVAGFLRPVVERAQAVLPRGGHMVLNIADLRVRRGGVIPLVVRTINLAHSSGFSHVETLQMPLAAINRKSPTEPVLVFRKT